MVKPVHPDPRAAPLGGAPNGEVPRGGVLTVWLLEVGLLGKAKHGLELGLLRRLGLVVLHGWLLGDLLAEGRLLGDLGHYGSLGRGLGHGIRLSSVTQRLDSVGHVWNLQYRKLPLGPT